MSEDVKNTKEMMLAFLKIAALLAANFKDGLQAADFVFVAQKIFQDEELKFALLSAYNDAGKIPAEVKDLSASEAIELLVAATPELTKLIKALV